VKIVCVTSCITGIAHTYMAAEALEQAGKKLGHEVLVETQGSAGSNPFKQEVIDSADGVIFAVDLEVKDRERFTGKPFLQVGVAKAINGSVSLVELLIEQINDGTAAKVGDAVAAKAVPAKSDSDPAKKGFFGKLFGGGH
jgi:fructose PTS system EIIB component